MSGYVQVLGPCLVCREPFTYNPVKVPSHPARRGPNGLEASTDPSDPKEPICEGCITIINAERAKLGEPTWTVAPGAYEAAPEGEVF